MRLYASPKWTLMADIESYVQVTKPRTVFLLVFTSIAAMLAALHSLLTSQPIAVWISGVAAITAACAGCNAATCYIDRDIDAVMQRTKNRPLPSKRIAPPRKALYFALMLIALSLILAMMRNFLAFLAIALGVFDNVIVYSLLSKRKTPFNILLGSVSGGLPVIFGWAFMTNSINLTAVLMAVLVMLWIPNHIWSLALRFKEDYAEAKVPMLPVVMQETKAIRYIVATSILLIIFSLWIFFESALGLVYLTTAVILGGVMFALNVWLFAKPTKQTAWIVFKFSSPYLAIIFLAVIIDSLIL